MSICFSRTKIIRKSLIKPSKPLSKKARKAAQSINPESSAEKKERNAELFQSLLLVNGSVRVIAIDTNRRNFFVSAERVYDAIDPDPDGDPTSIRIHDIRSQISTKEWKSVRGLYKAKKERESRFQANSSAFQALLNHPNMSCLGTNIAHAQTHMMFITKHWSTLCGVYFARWYRRSRMSLYSMSQKSWYYITQKLQLSMKKTHGQITHDKSNTMIVLGNGSFNTSSPGHEPLPSARKLYYELVKQGYHVVWQDEFRTSKLCSNCHNVVEEHAIHSFSIQAQIIACVECFIFTCYSSSFKETSQSVACQQTMGDTNLFQQILSYPLES